MKQYASPEAELIKFGLDEELMEVVIGTGSGEGEPED